MREKKFFKKIFNYYKKNKKIPKVDLHVHTNWTDGKHSVTSMVDQARKKKLKLYSFVNTQEKLVKDGSINLL